MQNFSPATQAIPRRLTCWALLLAAGWSLAQSAWAQQDLGQVYSSGPGRKVVTIAVPPFQPMDNQPAPDTPPLAGMIENDLILSGFFNKPANDQFVRETQQLDLNTGTIHADEWRRIGAAYVIKATIKAVDNSLIAEAKTYDTSRPNNYVFGKRYENYTVREARQLAHRISDDIVQRLTGEPGIANSRIVFVRGNDRYGQSKQICVMDSDGAGLCAVTSADALVVTPCWGAHGTEVYYTTYRDYNPDLAGLILSTGRGWWISRQPDLNISPDWSERRQRIALVLTKDGNSEIYTVGRGGQDFIRLTDNRAIDCSPCWSPDGSEIAFTSDRGGNQQIYIMNAESQEVRRLTNQGPYNDGASWAAAGCKRIAYASRINGIFQIFTINPDGSDAQQITSGPANSEEPTWAPNGWTLAFTSDRSGRRQIHTMFADGSNPRQLTSGAPVQSPRWSPAMPW